MAKMSVTLAIFLVACTVGSGLAAKQIVIDSETKEVQRPAKPETTYNDHLGRSSPQGTVLGFIKSATQGDYELARQYLDTKKTDISAQKLIIALKSVLDRGFQGESAIVSNRPEGDLGDNLPPSKERVGVVKTPSGSFDILLERVQRGKDPPIWLFSTGTLNQALKINKALGFPPIDAYIPEFLTDTLFMGFPLRYWLTSPLFILLSFGVATLVTRLLNLILLLLARRIFRVPVDQHVVRLTGPIRILFFALAVWLISFLSRSVLTSLFWSYVASTLTVVGLTWLSMRLIDITFNLKQRQLAVTSSNKVPILQLVRKLSKALAVTLGGFVIFYIAGINITAALTGLGIGGIAIAFASQKTLENLFGGIMILFDQPVRVGDFCRVGDTMGTVEDIGLRSTRLRTLDRTIVSVPNGQLAMLSLENFSVRDKIWFHHTLHLRYETTADHLRYILAEIRRMLYEHPKVESPSARIRLIGFGSSSLDLEIFAYVLETRYEIFLEIQEDLLLRLMDIIEASGSGFALPSQMTHVTKDNGLDAAKSQEAMSTVRRWREKGELPFPDFPPETISEIDNKIKYPPPGSALRDKR